MTSMRQEPLGTSADEPLLLDSYLGEYDVAEVHACIVNGDVKATWEAISNADLSSVPVVHSLLVLRSLPGRLRAIKSGEEAPAPPPFSFGDMPGAGFQLLAERERRPNPRGVSLSAERDPTSAIARRRRARRAARARGRVAADAAQLLVLWSGPER